MKKRLAGLEQTSPVRIGIDEVAYARRHKYLTVVRDVDASRVIWVGEGRRKETLDGFFRNFLGSAKTARIRLAVIDMWDPYIASVGECCPGAEIVFDKFHIAKKANEALDQVRKQEFADASRDERKRMKHKRFLILKRNDTLDEEQKEDVDCLMKRNKTLYKSYLLKEQLSSILDEPRLDVAAGRLGRWFRNVGKAGIPQFEKLVKTFRNYLYGILNYFKHRVTNAASEAFNNKIGLLKRIAYGFRDLEYFKLKIICCCGSNSS
jgi:transposase